MVAPVTGSASVAPWLGDEQDQREVLRVLRVARRILSRNGAEAAATNVQIAIDLVDPRTPQISARLMRGLDFDAACGPPIVGANTVRQRSIHE